MARDVHLARPEGRALCHGSFDPQQIPTGTEDDPSVDEHHVFTFRLDRDVAFTGTAGLGSELVIRRRQIAAPEVASRNHFLLAFEERSQDLVSHGVGPALRNDLIAKSGGV